MDVLLAASVPAEAAGHRIIAALVMLVFAGPVSRFVEANPTPKMLALSFLLLIGVMLVAEGIGSHFDKRFVYFGMGFSLIVEFLHLRVRNLARVKADQDARESESMVTSD